MGCYAERIELLIGMIMCISNFLNIFPIEKIRCTYTSYLCAIFSIKKHIKCLTSKIDYQ